MQNNVIEIENLNKSFGSHEVLSNVNLAIEKGKSLVIIGGSGTGKSVLIKTIIGLIKPTYGSIKIDGANIIAASSKDKAAFLARSGFLFQGGALFDSLTIEENVTFFASRLYNLNSLKRRELAVEKLNSVGLNDRVLKLYPSELSGGMQKRAALARTIATNPEIIFFDEPTTGLDPIMSNVINELIVSANKKLGSTSITITHDMHSARTIADKVAMLYKGEIIWQGAVAELETTDNPYVRQFVSGSTTGPSTLSHI
ncbi:MAG: ATP-binding cassette domain-containing protein [Alphaproteobacteria bacterium]|nr:ATP-binding cassette domain-containing protein [Alphaproteobacteria bacterium]